MNHFVAHGLTNRRWRWRRIVRHRIQSIAGMVDAHPVESTNWMSWPVSLIGHEKT